LAGSLIERKRRNSCISDARISLKDRREILTEAYSVFNVTPIIKKYDDVNRKEVVIETPPDNETKGRTGTP